MAGLQLLGKAERQVISKELDRLRKILVAIDQMEACGSDCSDQRQTVQDLWKSYNLKLKHLYQESPENPPWAQPTGNELASATS